MADRGLDAPTIAALGDAKTKYYYLVKMEFATVLNYTLAPRAIDYDGDTYDSNGLVMDIPTIKESMNIRPSSLSLKMSGASSFLHLLTLAESYHNVKVSIFVHVPETDKTVKIFDGFISKFKNTEDNGKGKSTVEWTIANNWTNWTAKSGRYLTYENQIYLYPGDFGLRYASVATRPVQQSELYVGFDKEDGTSWAESIYAGDYGGKGDYGITYDTPQEDALEPTDEILTEKLRLPICYGNNLLSGYLVFSDFVLTNPQPTHPSIPGPLLFPAVTEYVEIYALSEGKCSALNEVYIDGLTVAEINAKANLVPPYEAIQVFFHDGDEDQLADTYMLSVAETDLWSKNWGTDFRLRGICYVVVVYNVFYWKQFQMIPPIFDFDGKLVIDPTDDVLKYSTNNAIIAYDYAINTSYGKGISPAETDRFIEAVVVCDELVQEDGGGSETIPRYRFEGVIDTEKSVKKNMEHILWTMNAKLPYVNGLYTLVMKQSGEVGTYVITEDNSGKFIVYDASQSEYTNEVTYEYGEIDRTAFELVIEQVFVQDAGFFAEDGRTLHKSYGNENERNHNRALNHAETLMKESREQIRVDCYITRMDALQLECGDILYITKSLQGWTLKPFRINELNIGKKEIFLKLREYESDVYDWDVQPEHFITSNTNINDVFTIHQPESLVLSSGTDELLIQADGTIIPRIRVWWFPSANPFLLKGYKVYINIVGDPDENEKLADTVSVNVNEIFISDVVEGVNYTISVTSYNDLGESVRVTDTIVVIGKTELPSDVVGLAIGSIEAGIVNLFWLPIADADFSIFEIIASPVNDRDDVNAVSLSSRLNFFNHATENDKYYWVRAIDTTGNVSEFWNPVSPTAGLLGSPDGLTALIDWYDIIGKPSDNILINTSDFRTDFEDEDFSNWWDNPVFGTVTQNADSFMGDYSGLFTSVESNPEWYELPRYDLPLKTSQVFAGKKIRISFYHKRPATGFTTRFAMRYDTGTGVGSDWIEFDSSTDWVSNSFTYDVPETVGAATWDFIMVNGDIYGNGNGVLIDNIIIDIVSDADILAELQSGSGINIMSSRYSTFEDSSVPIPHVQQGTVVYSTLERYSGKQSALLTATGIDAAIYLTDDADSANTGVGDFNISIEPAQKWIISYQYKIITGTGDKNGNIFAKFPNPGQAIFKSDDSFGNYVYINDGEWHKAELLLDLTSGSGGTGGTDTTTNATTNVTGLPIDFFDSGSPQQADLIVTVNKPGTAINNATITMTVHDADFSDEGSIAVNGNPSQLLFQTQTGGDLIDIEVTFTVDESEWNDGVNTVTIAHLRTQGFIIKAFNVEFEYTTSSLQFAEQTEMFIRIDHNCLIGDEIAFDQVMVEKQIGIGREASAYAEPGATIGIDIGFGRIKVFVEPNTSIPTSVTIGDIWFDSADNNKMYVAAAVGVSAIGAGQWELQSDIRIEDGVSALALQDNQIVAFYSDTVPTVGVKYGDRWFETDNNNLMYRAESDGSNQVIAGEWEVMVDQSSAIAWTQAETANATADRKIVTFVQNNVPDGGGTQEVGAGDIWLDKDANYMMYIAELDDANSITGDGGGGWVQRPQDYAEYAKITGDKPPPSADTTIPVMIGAKINYDGFSTPNNGEVWFHGYDSAGDPADVNGWITYNGLQKEIIADQLNPGVTLVEGYILYRVGGWPGGDKFALGYPKAAQGLVWDIYENNTERLNYTISINDIIIGICKMGATDIVQSASVWGYGLEPTAVPLFGADATQPTLEDGVLLQAGGIELGVNSKIWTSGKVDYGDIDSGIFFGYSGTEYKVDIGDLNNYLRWDGSTLNIKGSITLTNTISSSDISDVVAFGGTSSSISDVEPFNGTSSSISDVAPYDTDQDLQSFSTLEVDTPSGTGLFLDATHLGYYDTGVWKTYMDSSGNFYLGGTSGSLTWNASTSELIISGDIVLGSTDSLVTGVSPNKRIEINSGGSNEVEFFGDAGGGVEALCNIGLNTFGGGDYAVGNFGSNTNGNDKYGVYSRSYSGTALFGKSITGVGTYGYSDTAHGSVGITLGSSAAGLYGLSSSTSSAFAGVVGANYANSVNAYGGYFISTYGIGLRAKVTAVNRPGIYAESTGVGGIGLQAQGEVSVKMNRRIGTLGGHYYMVPITTGIPGHAASTGTVVCETTGLMYVRRSNGSWDIFN